MTARRFAFCFACLMGASVLPACGESGGGQGGEAAKAAFPERAAGLWEQAASIDGLEARGLSRVCVDAASDQTLWAFALGQGLCALKEARSGGVYLTECRQGGLILTNEIRASGDFRSAYELKVSTAMKAGEEASPMEKLMASGPAPATTISARRIGECPAEVKPGDFLIEGAVVNNLLERAADLRPAP